MGQLSVLDWFRCGMYLLMDDGLQHEDEVTRLFRSLEPGHGFSSGYF